MRQDRMGHEFGSIQRTMIKNPRILYSSYIPNDNTKK